MEENVNGCYAQKPLKSCERIIQASSARAEVVLDFFAHSGSTLLACERLGRGCLTADIDPVYCEIAIRRLEHFRRTGKTGWQNSNPFARELENDLALRNLLQQQAQSSSEELSPVEAAPKPRQPTLFG
jgi:site-specific DNA-methyltransferase (adenine-specific)